MWTGRGDARNGEHAYAIYNELGELVLDGLTFLQMTTIVVEHNKMYERVRRALYAVI